MITFAAGVAVGGALVWLYAHGKLTAITTAITSLEAAVSKLKL